MKVNIIDQSGFEKNIEIKVPYNDLIPKFDELYKKYKKSIQLEGFRKGKVPLDLMKKVYGTKIELEAAENSISDYLQEAIDNNKIKFHELVKMESFVFNKKDGLSFSARIRIEPDIELKKYKGLKVEKEIYQVTDDDLNMALENFRERNATMETVEGEAQEGHFIVADLQKTDANAHPMIGEKYENRYFQLGASGVDDKVAAQLTGVKVGETRQVRFTQKKDESAEETEEFYAISVKEIKEKKLPEMDDAFAKDVGNYESLEVLKQKLRENIEQQASMNDKQKFYTAVMDQAVKNNPIEFPAFMVDDYLNALIKNMKADERNKIDENEIREKYKADAIWNLKWIAIKEKIAETENITLDDSAVGEYIENMVQNAGANAATIRREYRDKKRQEQISRELLEIRVIDFLVEHAKISEKKVTFQDLKNRKEIVK